MTRDWSPLMRTLLALPDAERAALLRDIAPADQRDLDRAWAAWARTAQRPPPGDWRVWLIMAGRGFGKTRAGAEWVHTLARAKRKTRIALVAATLDEARAVMVEGESGLLAVGNPAWRPKWEPSLGKLTWRNGTVAFVYSAENPDGLRGPQHRYAWCDELAKWTHGTETWDNLMFGLRDGPDQRVLVTTTPRPGALLKRLIADPRTVRTGGGTIENLFLSPAYVESVQAAYGGTRLGRQELDGELIDDVEGALWTRAMLEAAREGAVSSGRGAGNREQGAREERDDSAPRSLLPAPSEPSESSEPLPAPFSRLPDFTRIVIAVDPPASATGDACGIVACGLDRAGIGHVLEDASVEGELPEGWARAVAECAARWGADRVIAEANNGGEMVRSTLRAFDPGLPVALAHASRGKGARAEPVALLYQQGRVRHRGVFPRLEDQLCGLTPGGYVGPGRSPDRADALVWALTELMVRVPRAAPRIRTI